MFSVVGLGFLLIAGVFAGAVVMALRGNAGLDLGRVIGDAAGVITRAPLLFAGLAIVGAGLPNAALFVLIAAAPFGSIEGSPVALIGLSALLAYLAWYQFFLLAMVAATLEALGGTSRPRGVIAAALPLVPRALLASLIYWLSVGIGLSFFVVPGVVLACVWMLVMPVIVEERPGLLAAFGRAARLSRGARWQLFLLAVVGFVFGIVVQSMCGALAAMLGGMAARIAFALLSSLLGVLPPALVASAYHQIVRAREGPRTRELEEIFA